MDEIDDITAGIMPISEDFADCLYDSDYVGWRPSMSREDAEKELVSFLRVYGKYYFPQNLAYIKNNFHNFLSLRGVDTKLGQIYSHLEIYKKENDTYLGYAKKLEEYFDLKRDIFDIASGDYPAFAEKIAKRQIELGCGTVTVMDPALVCTDITPYPNMKVHRKCYTSFTPIDSFSLITTTLPCNLTHTLLNRMVCGNQDFFMALCACLGHNYIWPDFKSHTYTRTYEIALDYAFSLYEKRGKKGELIVEHLDSKYNASQPILIYKANK